MSERRPSRNSLAPPRRDQNTSGTWHGERRGSLQPPQLTRAASIFDRRPSFVPPSRVQV